MKLSDFAQDPKNANAGTDRGRALVEHSLRTYGAGRSILVDKDGVIVAGNKTAAAAAAIGLDDAIVVETTGDRLVVVKRTDLDLDSDPAARELALADNRAGELGLAWDTEVLAELGAELDLGQFWTKDELRDLLPREVGGGGDEFDTTPQDGPTRVQPGDLWQLGEHRLLCGDSTKNEDVERLMAGGRAAQLVTSPPYWTGQPYDDKPGVEGVAAFMADVATAWANVVARRMQIQTGHTNSTLVGDAGPMRKVFLDALWAEAMAAHGWLVRHRRVWAKGGGLLHIAPTGDVIDESWEVILTFYRDGHNEGGQERVGEGWAQKGVWSDIVGTGGDGSHPCPFPVELAGRMVLLYSKADDVIADPFCGSGTTLIAAERLARRCYGIEIEPRYCDVILRRYEAETGDQPVRLEP
jgi:DNA methylase